MQVNYSKRKKVLLVSSGGLGKSTPFLRPLVWKKFEGRSTAAN